ncbi:MAG: hypothetical protein ISR90_00350 [Candidatus Marinimicrobia bacterium]|nr:hypothetical protein [Candidatus Neomarinimicrobiota bacterium]MBL7022492.1 hypothetical protein [Candidatus Neomarinimicrobiota bacterium]MBL7108653.1 hypothetical protein [Candidatus Neomarinimicrobiota bacterium]
MSERIKIGGLFERTNLCMIEILGIKDEPGSAGHIFKLFSKHNISIEFITSSFSTTGGGSMSLGMSDEHCHKVEELSFSIEELIKPDKIVKRPAIAMLTVYGPHFAEKPRVAEIFCTELGNNKVNILGISTSINSITCVINKCDLFQAKEAINLKFELPEY